MYLIMSEESFTLLLSIYKLLSIIHNRVDFGAVLKSIIIGSRHTVVHSD